MFVFLRCNPISESKESYMKKMLYRSRASSKTLGERVGVAIGVAGLLFGMAQIAIPTAAQAKPEFAAQTGLPCGQCHVSPAGGGKLKAFGEKFKANGFKLKK
jgi:hypothetical protein